MAAHFENNKVARKGFSKFFIDNSNEEREHAQKIISYINSRGGTIAAFKVSVSVGDQFELRKKILGDGKCSGGFYQNSTQS